MITPVKPERISGTVYLFPRNGPTERSRPRKRAAGCARARRWSDDSSEHASSSRSKTRDGAEWRGVRPRFRFDARRSARGLAGLRASCSEMKTLSEQRRGQKLQISTMRRSPQSRADRRPAGPHPAFLSLDALHADHVVPNVGTAVDKGVRLPRLAGLKRGDSVGLAVDEGLIAVGMIGDIPVHAGLLSNLEEAV